MPPARKRAIAASAPCLAAALLLSACSAPMADSARPDGLVVAETTAPSTLDPQGSSMYADRFAWQLSYECLYTTTADGRVEPALATGYDESADGLTYTFTLRHGVRFHNGSPLTADDVVYSFDRLHKGSDGIDEELFPTLKGVEKVDAEKVSFKLKTPDAGFINNMANPLVWGCAIMSRHADASNPATTMVGTGPWKQTSYRANSELRLERNDDYWGKKAAAPALSVLYIPNVATQVANLQVGKIDLMFPDAASAAALKGRRDVALDKVETDSTIFLQINNLRKPLDNQLVRQALALAVDRGELAEGAYHDGARPSVYIPPSSAWAPSVDRLPYSQPDLDRAKKLLSQAGYPHGFSTTLMYISGYDPGTDNLMTLMQAQLARVGIKVKLLPLERAAWSSKLTGPDYDLSWNAQSYYSNPIQYVLPAEGRQGPTPAELRKLLDDARAAGDQAAYQQALTKISEYEATHVYPTVTLLATNTFAAYRNVLDHVAVPPSQSRTFLTDVTKE
ncbi:ABC transporter substrate-binding protein [Streptomyces sp. NPDC056309]|uniref:ABC transporter substrate-binding protein n=1 Tax=unclassified Streptomyces TaxID=2593676 RepID=UPI0035D68D30